LAVQVEEVFGKTGVQDLTCW